MDVAIIAPVEGGYRVGWLDELPAAAPRGDEGKDREGKGKGRTEKTKKTDRERAEEVLEKGEADAKKEKDKDEPKPLPAEADADVRARVDQILNRPVNVNAEQAPRSEVLNRVAGQARLRYELDEKTIIKADVNLAKPMTLKAVSVAARDASRGARNSWPGLPRHRRWHALRHHGSAAGRRCRQERAAIQGPPISSRSRNRSRHPIRRTVSSRDSYARRLARQGFARKHRFAARAVRRSFVRAGRPDRPGPFFPRRDRRGRAPGRFPRTEKASANGPCGSARYRPSSARPSARACAAIRRQLTQNSRGSGIKALRAGTCRRAGTRRCASEQGCGDRLPCGTCALAAEPAGAVNGASLAIRVCCQSARSVGLRRHDRAGLVRVDQPVRVAVKPLELITWAQKPPMTRHRRGCDPSSETNPVRQPPDWRSGLRPSIAPTETARSGLSDPAARRRAMVT